jgi:molybdenum cofactor biosynthesis protein B
VALQLIEAAGHLVVARDIVRDEPEAIRAAVEQMLAGDARAVYLTGGTGIAPRDRTPDTVEPMLERVLPGFGELFRMLSFEQIGSATILSRALCGLRGGKVVFVTPGSTKAVELALTRIILPEVGHILGEAGKA